MLSVPPFLTQALTIAAYFKYPLVFVGALVEGPILMVASGLLLQQGFFSFWPLFLTLILGDLAGDVLWYCVGYFFAEPLLKKHGRIFSLTPEMLEKSKALFHRQHSVILFVSKITMGFGMALGTLMAAGAARIPFRTYIFFNALGEVIFVSILLLIGHSFGGVFSSVDALLKPVFLVAMLLLVGVAIYGFMKFLKKKSLHI